MAQVEPVQSRQTQVEHDYIEPLLQCKSKTGRSIRCMVHDVAPAFEEIPDIGGDVVLVFDYEDFQWTGYPQWIIGTAYRNLSGNNASLAAVTETRVNAYLRSA